MLKPTDERNSAKISQLVQKLSSSVCVSTLPSAVEIKSYTRFSSDSLELYLLLFLSPSFGKIGCEGFNTRYRGWHLRHVPKEEHGLFITLETETSKIEVFRASSARKVHSAIEDQCPVPREVLALSTLTPC